MRALAGLFGRGKVLRDGRQARRGRLGAKFSSRKARGFGCDNRAIALAARVLGDRTDGSALEERRAGGRLWGAWRQGTEAIRALSPRGERRCQFAAAKVHLERLEVEIGNGGVAGWHVGRQSRKPGLSRVCARVRGEREKKCGSVCRADNGKWLNFTFVQLSNVRRQQWASRRPGIAAEAYLMI